MPTDKMSQSDGSLLATITARSAASILSVVQRFDCQEADVFGDDDYAFSVRLDSKGSWCFYERK